MKIKHTKQSKRKGAKLKLEKLKIKSVQKVKNSVRKTKRMSSSKQSSKCGKKKLNNERIDNESSSGCPNSQEEEQRNLSSSFRIQMLTEDFTFINVNKPDSSCGQGKFVKNIEDNRRSMDPNSNAEAEACSSPRSKHIKKNRDCKKPRVYCIRNIVIVIMENGSGFCFIGKLLVKVLYGAVKIYGAVLNASSNAAEIYSPKGYSNITIETSETFPEEDNIQNIWSTLSAEGITHDLKSKLQVDIDKIQPGTTVFTLRNFENNLTLFLRTHCPFKLFPNIKNSCYYPSTHLKRAETVLQTNMHLTQDDNIVCKQLIVDPCITTDIAEKMISRWRANEWSCTLIAGGKNVGKSTSVRCLINSLLRTSKKVVLVDVDPGQAECTPAYCISYSLIEDPLLGPNFTHLKTPIYQLFIDEVNVSQCVERYLEGIKMLIEKLRTCPVLSRLPIVVNTMGFTSYIGWDLIIFTIKLIRPSIILQIMSTKEKNNYMDVLSSEVVNKQVCAWTFCGNNFVDWNRPCDHELCTIGSHAEDKTRTNEWNMEPYQQRELVMMSYFSGIVHNSNDTLQYNAGFSLSINEMLPYKAPFSSLCIIPRRSFGVPISNTLRAVNGNVTALCGIDLMEEPSQNISNLRILTQRSPLCTCYGFGIIRGVDMEQQEVFINTPLPMSDMQFVNCLAGCITIPSPLLQLNHSAPYVGGNVTLPTSREARRGYFRMKYKTKPNNSNKLCKYK